MEEFMCTEGDAERAYYEVYRELVHPVEEASMTWSQVSEILGVTIPVGTEDPGPFLASELDLEYETFLAMMAEQGIAIPQRESRVMHLEKHERFAQLLLKNWFRRIGQWRSEEVLIKAGGTASQTGAVAAVLEALELGVERTRLKTSIASEVEMEFAQPTPSSNHTVSAAALSTRVVNRYARSCGWEMVDGGRPEHTPGDQIFRRNRAAVTSRDAIVPHQTGPSTYWEDWVLGLSTSYVENVKYNHNIQDPSFIEANETLGRIIESIGQTSA
jgi:hypothetical protein